MNGVTYQWVSGSRLRGNAQAVGQELERIRKAKGGLTAESVLIAARPRSSVFHRHFTWDDTRAANERRLDQARALIRFVAVKIERLNDEPLVVRSFVKTEAGYGSTIKLASQESNRAEMLKQALWELEVFRAKYEKFTELSEIFEAAESLRKKLAKRKAA